MNGRNHRLPSLNALRVFEVVARHLNFRLAAEELHVTQGAVAQHIRGLEAELGLKLFDRLPRILVITEAGRSYAEAIRQAFALIGEATEALKPEPRQLTISVTPTFASKWLIPRLGDFTAAHPDIDLQLLATDRLSSFQSDGIDLAVRYGKPPFGPGLNVEYLFEGDVIAVGSPTLLEKYAPPDELQNLGHYSLLHDTHNYWPQLLARAFPNAAPVAAKNIRFNQTGLAIDAAIAGQGLALANRHFVEAELAAGRLVSCFASRLHMEMSFYVISLRSPRNRELVATVSEWLREQVDEGINQQDQE